MSGNRRDLNREAARRAATSLERAELRLSRMLGETERCLARVRPLHRRLMRRRRKAAKLEARIIARAGAGQGVKAGDRARLERYQQLVTLTQERLADPRRRLRHARAAVKGAKAGLAAARRDLDPDRLALSARRLEELARDRRAAQASGKARREARLDLDRDGPTPDQVLKRGTGSRVAGGAVRLDDEIPETLRRMVRAGQLDLHSARAAGRWRSDWLFGSSRARMAQRYEIRVDGGKAGGAVELDKVQAWRRYEMGGKVLPGGLRRTAEAVILHEATLGESPGASEAYAAGSPGRRAAAGALVIVACDLLRAFYDKEFGRS